MDVTIDTRKEIRTEKEIKELIVVLEQAIKKEKNITEQIENLKLWIYGLYVLIAGYIIFFLYVLWCLTQMC